MTRWAQKMTERRAAGLCRRCGAPQVSGCALCETHRDEERERRRAKYAQRKSAGMCIEHGCPRKSAGGHLRCKTCHAAYTIYGREWQRVHRKKPKKAER